MVACLGPTRTSQHHAGVHREGLAPAAQGLGLARPANGSLDGCQSVKSTSVRSSSTASRHCSQESQGCVNSKPPAPAPVLASEAVAEGLAHEPGRWTLGCSEDNDLTAAASVERAALLVPIRLVLERLSHGPETVAATPEPEGLRRRDCDRRPRPDRHTKGLTMPDLTLAHAAFRPAALEGRWWLGRLRGCG